MCRLRPALRRAGVGTGSVLQSDVSVPVCRLRPALRRTGAVSGLAQCSALCAADGAAHSFGARQMAFSEQERKFPPKGTQLLAVQACSEASTYVSLLCTVMPTTTFDLICYVISNNDPEISNMAFLGWMIFRTLEHRLLFVLFFFNRLYSSVDLRGRQSI